MNKIKLFICLILPLFLTACGFHLRENFLFPKEIKIVSLTSFDKYGKLHRLVKNELVERGINVLQPATDIPNINIDSESYSSNVASLYQTATTAEKELKYSFSYTVTIRDEEPQTFKTVAFRSYISNPLTALASSIEQEQLKDEMRDAAVAQMIRQLARLNKIVKPKAAPITAEEKALIKQRKEKAKETQQTQDQPLNLKWN